MKIKTTSNDYYIILPESWTETKSNKLVFWFKNWGAIIDKAY